jgi:hypothetical protein
MPNKDTLAAAERFAKETLDAASDSVDNDLVDVCRNYCQLGFLAGVLWREGRPLEVLLRRENEK